MLPSIHPPPPVSLSLTSKNQTCLVGWILSAGSSHFTPAVADFWLSGLLVSLQGMGRDAFDAQNVANILHAYATLGIRDEQLFAWMSQVARSYEPGHFDAQHISNIIHSLAVLGIEDSQLVAHLFNNVLRSRQTSLFQKDFNPQAMANLAWGVAVLEVRDTQIHSWIASSCASKIGEMDKNALSQLHQFLLSCELQGLHGTSDRIISDLGAHRLPIPLPIFRRIVWRASTDGYICLSTETLYAMLSTVGQSAWERQFRREEGAHQRCKETWRLL